MVQKVKPLPATLTSTQVLVQVLATPLPVWLPAPALGKQWKMAQALDQPSSSHYGHLGSDSVPFKYTIKKIESPKMLKAFHTKDQC